VTQRTRQIAAITFSKHLPLGDCAVFKKFSLAVVALVLMAGSVMAEDSIDSLDIASISDANNAVVEANFDVDVDNLTQSTSDEAVEACFRRWGGYCGYNYGCYNYCYNYCYTPCYSYCYTPVYYCYRPVVYHTYCYQPLTYWGCY
jgi:hypothetical protein